MKINVLTVKLTCHIPIDPADAVSRDEAGKDAEGLIALAADIGLGQPVVEVRQNRVTAPEPKPEAPEAADEPAEDEHDLDIPDNLRRTPAAAE